MSFSFDGSASARISRNSGNVSNTNAFTQTFWVKRTSDPSGLKTLLTYRAASDTDGHDIILNDPGQTANKLDLQANYATAQAISADALALNVWTFVAMVGSGANISLKYWDGSVIVTATVGQTAFVPAQLRVGDAGAGTTNFTGLIAHLRSWNAALSDAELIAEKNAVARVRTANHLSSHSGDGGTISAALLGEVGTAFQSAGSVTYSSDSPTFSSFAGITISGSADMPFDVVVSASARVNRLLQSGTLADAVWAKQGNALVVGAASIAVGYGTTQRCTIQVTTGGIYQKLLALPSGKSVAVMAFKRVDADYVVFRHMLDGFGSGAQGFFNLVTGAWDGTSVFGTITAGDYGVYAIGGGWYLIWIAITAGGDRIVEFYPCVANTAQMPALNKSIDVAAAQYEDVQGGIVKATYHKPTTTAIVTRDLTSAVMTLGIATIGVGQATTATVQLLDDIGAPWDQATVDTFTSSDTSKATTGTLSGNNQTDRSGRLVVTVSGVATGTTNIAATSGSVTAPSKVLTVSGTSIARWVRIYVEPGWQGTSGWFVGVYVTHVSGRFPQAFLFEASGQKFMDNLAPNNGQSFMDVAVPVGVSVTLGQVVEAVIENDNLNGKAVDGPGIFPATVI